jgi:uncharacterized coiled-coil protein SlyX
MPVEYKRTDDPDIFLELWTQIKQLSMSKLEAQLAELNEQIQEFEGDIPTDKVTAAQKIAIELYNFQMQDIIRNVIEQRDTLKSLIERLKALPEKMYE